MLSINDHVKPFQIFLMILFCCVTSIAMGANKKPLTETLPTLHSSDLAPYYEHLLLSSKQEMLAVPFVVGAIDHRVVVSAGDTIYVGGLLDPVYTNYNIYRVGRPVKDPETGQWLGFATNYIGSAQLEQVANPSSMVITNATMEVLKGDRVIAQKMPKLSEGYLKLTHPSKPVRGQVAYVDDGILDVGQYQLVILNRGTEDGLKPGNVVTAYHLPEQFNKYQLHGVGPKPPFDQIPRTRVGRLLILKTYPHASVAVVATLKANLKINDWIDD